MRRAGVACLAALLFATAAAAQHDGTAGTQVSDVPAGIGAIRGEVANPDDPSRVGDVEILLYALPASGTPGLRRARSDGAGRFAFEGIANDASTAYLVGARYAGIPYPGERLSFAAGETEKRVTVRVGDPSEDASGAAVVEARLEVTSAGGRIGISELHRFENHGAHTVFVAEPRRAEAKPFFRARLPKGAEEFKIPLGIQPEGLVRDGDELRFYGPLYPSSWPGPLAKNQGLAFQYKLPATSGTLVIEKEFPSGAQRVVVLVPSTGPKLQVVGAREEKPETQAAEGEAPPQQFVVDRVAPGGKLTLKIDVPESRIDPDAVHLEETRLFLELDDTALSVQQETLLVVSGDSAVVAPPGGSLLTLPMATGAQNVRFDRDAFAFGLAPGDGAGAVLSGPLPPGETKLQIAYRLPVTDPSGAVALELRFDRTLPLLSIYIADTGLRTESDRLHRRRPVKTTDRTYIALEAFQVEPSETVRLSLAPLGAPAKLPRAALYAVVALAAGLVVSFVAVPLRAARRASSADDAMEIEDAALHEREAVYASLRDLDHDHETAKISDGDYQSMRRELRDRAAALLRASASAGLAGARSEPQASEDHRDAGLAGARSEPQASEDHRDAGLAGARSEPQANEVQQSAPASAAFCTACGTRARASDRFCAQCGTRIETGEARV
jgi:hypothetical protein